ncbi:MAG: glycosyltransferase [Gemmatimonadaceae bacterium]
MSPATGGAALRTSSVAARRTRVLHIIQNLNYGGMERLLADIVRQVDPARFESHVLVLQYAGRFAEELRGAATLHLAQPMGRWSMLWPSTLIDQIRGISPDVVHTHTGVWYKGTLAARRAGVPRLIHTDHGRESPDPWRARIQDGFASRRTHVVVAVSDTLARQLARTVVHDRGRIQLVPNGVDTGVNRPRPDNGVVRGTLGIPAGAPVLGSIGRLEHIKGYDVMVEAFALFPADAGSGGASAHLVLGGDGGERPRLEERARALGVGDRVHFLGWRDDVPDLHAAFSLFTMSSRSEGTSVSLLEAMSAGLCPVVTNVGGNAAVLGPDLGHRLVAPENPGALAAAWRAALGDAAARADDGARARDRVLESFSLTTMVRHYEALYQGRGP